MQNLPFGKFRRAGTGEPWRIGVAIGDQVLDLKLAREQCPWAADVETKLALLAAGNLDAVMAMPKAERVKLRAALSQALSEGSDQAPFLDLCLLPQTQAEMCLPCHIGDYTDFYTGIHHATAVGKLFRPDNPLLPTTGVVRRSGSAANNSAGRWASSRPRAWTPSSGRASGWTMNSNSVHSSPCPMRPANRY